ncbi:hypothetical protein OG884_05610 [Streptosporangium sp. NBC_01755]|uniref:hypothetical protein n=1 Tax=Streptosporangium sp. NBC_01755 TaxID=2975949 RepID=UPI002DD7FB0B|nr:hypothetical protein [Streptosporangium sp. NBC_01755]WSD01401.1 hypothetical protein OG884_05610 [Streptosporangium sp. NBC_01755]
MADYLPPIPSWVPDVVAALVIGLGVIATLFALWELRKGAKALIRKAKTSKTPGEDLLTWVAAAIATGVSAQGMWRFAGDILGFDGPLRLLLFAFIEVAMFTSAVRARRNMRENFSAGIDGLAVWVLTCLSAVLSCMDARSIPEAVFRLAAPLVAAWLWERGMAIERHRATGRKRIHWRITPERVLVRLGVAESRDRTAEEVDAQRRLTKVALAAKKARALEQAGKTGWKMRRAMTRLEGALDAAMQHTVLARDEALQRSLLDGVTTAYSAPSLMQLPPVAAWAHLDHPAVTGAAKNSEAVKLAGALSEWTAAIEREHDPEVSAAVTSMAAYITGGHVTPATTPVTGAAAYPSLIDATGQVLPPSPEGRSWLASLKPWSRPEPRPETNQEDDHAEHPVPVAEPVAETVAESDQDGDRDGNHPDDRDSAAELDNGAAEEWIRARCRGKNGAGRKPSQREVADKYKHSVGWARNRLAAVQERMTAQGYTFQHDGTVLAPRRAVTEPASAASSPNGSSATTPN